MTPCFVMLNLFQHLFSDQAHRVWEETWTLKQVQGDDICFNDTGVMIADA